MFDESLNGHGASEPNGMVERGDAVLISGVEVGSRREQGDDSLSLVFGVGIPLNADL